MAPYDRRAWTEIERWRAKRLTARTRRVLPQKARDKISDLGHGAKERFEALPGAADFEALFVKALGGLLDFGSRAAMATVREKAVLKGFRKHGHAVEELEDIAEVELRDIDKVKPNLALAYTATATVEGAAAGFMISGGEIVAAGGAVAGAGAGAAPGIGTVVGVMAGDAAAVLVAANRAVAHTAAYYGYNVDQPEERLFALAVLSMGTAAESGKAAAYIEINKLVQMLVRGATWDQLRQSVVTRVIEKVFTRLGFRITQRKLGQAVPVLGTVIGAGMNARLISSVIDDADHIYRERFLRERYGLDPAAVEVTVDTADTADTVVDNDADVIDVAELLEEEIRDEGGRALEAGAGE
ncbi:EcsC family protein [Nocardioides halotolerans]|uniref:EcsC family protein n=1 Tax=Nocardioides halotolerans TaxID=433660 RepID=UPI00146E05AD|nr:EcsC family protein [Nocardioides halotolerans]